MKIKLIAAIALVFAATAGVTAVTGAALAQVPDVGPGVCVAYCS